MIFYITYNDAPSGIFSSQVIDVVKFMNSHLGTSVRLVSFISLRQFFENRGKIKQELSTAFVLPMFPGIKRWRSNVFILKCLCLFFKPRILIGRSVLATQLALKCRASDRKVVYDGRGAIASEWKEYSVVKDQQMLKEIPELERDVVVKSDFRIAVSEQLLNYWRKNFNYKSSRQIVVPCTLNTAFEQTNLDVETIQESRKNLDLQQEDVVFVYSGSLAGWQSFELLYAFVAPLLKFSPIIKLLFLSDKDSHILKLEQEFPGQIICKKLSPKHVPVYLMAADYGLLIRERSITNKVASPVKFAEYLACGLKVIISEELGDYTTFTVERACGYIKEGFSPDMAKPISLSSKKKIRQLAIDNFTKQNFKDLYKKLVTLN